MILNHKCKNIFFVFITAAILSVWMLNDQPGFTKSTNKEAVVDKDSLIIYSCINFYSINKRWPTDFNDLISFLDKPKGNLNKSLFENLSVEINSKGDLQIKFDNGREFRKFELIKTVKKNPAFQVKYVDSNDPELKQQLPFTVNFDSSRYQQFEGVIR